MNPPRSIYKRIEKKKWTKSEFLNLKRLVKIHGQRWSLISRKIGKRNARQCMQKYLIHQRGKNLATWSAKEDRVIGDWVGLYGEKDWNKCATKFPDKNARQCQQRWAQKLAPTLKKGFWSNLEQARVFSLMEKFATSWSLMQFKVKGRTQLAIKNFVYNSVRAFQSSSVYHWIQQNRQIKSNFKFTSFFVFTYFCEWLFFFVTS